MSNDTPPENEATTEPTPQEGSVSEAALEKQLESGVLHGDVGTDTAQIWISAFIIAALGFVIYLYSFSIPLHGEDLDLFGGDAPIGRLVTALELLPEMPTAPLSILGLSMNGIIGGGTVDALHGGSVLLHLLCGILVFLVARRLLPQGTPEAVAMIAGLLFLVHPLVNGPVNYLVARPVLQSTFFGLAGLVLLLRGCAPQCCNVLCLTASLFGFVLAFGSDTSALHFPLIGVALIYFRGSHGGESSDYRGVVAAVLLLSVAFMWVVGQASGLFAAAAIQNGLPAQLGVFLSQAGHGLYYGLIPTAHSVLPVSGGLVFGSIALLGIGLAIGFGIVWRRLPAVLGLWILLALLGAACYGPLEAVGPTRYLYVPWAAVCIGVPWAIQLLHQPRARVIAGGLSAVLILLLGMLSFQRCGAWVRPVDFWAAEALAHPDSLRPNLYSGRYLMSHLNRLEGGSDFLRGTAHEAEDIWKEILEQDPDSAEARENLGVLAMERGAFDEALPHLRIATARFPRKQDTALYLAHAAEQQAGATGQQEFAIEALRALEHARRLAPLPLPARERYGLLAARMGDFSTGLPILEQAAAENPDNNLAEPLKQFQALSEQANNLSAQIEKLLQESPQSNTILVLQAQRHLIEARVMNAFYLLQLAVSREPGNVSAWMLLGYTSAALNGAENFLADWGEAPGVNWEAWKQLALRCGAGGAWPGAEEYLRFGATRATGEEPVPELALADVALELNQGQRAVAYLQAAQQAHPENPTPWLRLADMALAAGDKNQARNLVDEAVKRNADPEAVKALSDKLGPQTPVREGITRTVIK